MDKEKQQQTGTQRGNYKEDQNEKTQLTNKQQQKEGNQLEPRTK